MFRYKILLEDLAAITLIDGEKISAIKDAIEEYGGQCYENGVDYARYHDVKSDVESCPMKFRDTMEMIFDRDQKRWGIESLAGFVHPDLANEIQNFACKHQNGEIK